MFRFSLSLIPRGGSRAAAISKMECFVIIVNNYYHKALHLGCCSSPRCASDTINLRLEQDATIETAKFLSSRLN